MSRAPKPQGLIPKSFSFFERDVPKLHRVSRAKEDFNAVLTGVTSSRDGDGCFFKGKIDNVISRWRLRVFAEERMK